VLPALNHCCFCGLSEGKSHANQDHKYERDTRRPEWHGWHAARRGLGSNLYRLGVPDKTIQEILRHSNVGVTLAYYVKSAGPDVVAGMQKLEEQLDSSWTVNPVSTKPI
jgi:integrase